MDQTMISFFMAVASTHSITQAAREMFVTKQMVSRSIRQLEKELGVPLFKINKTSVYLTAAGREYLALFEKMDSLLFTNNRKKREICQDKAIWISLDNMIGPAPVIIEALSHYSREKQVDFRFAQVGDGKALGLVLAQDADLAITSNYVADQIESLISIKVIEEIPMKIFLSQDHMLAGKEATTIIQKVPYYTSPSGEGDIAAVRDRVKNFFVKIGYMPDTIQIMPNLASVMLNVRMGNGFTIRPATKQIDGLLQIPTGRTISVVAVKRKDIQDPRLDDIINWLSARWHHE